MKLNEELAEWVADLRKMWSGKIEGSLSHLKRFLYAFVGACTFFFFLFVLRLRELLIAEKEAVERRDPISELLADPLGFFVVSFGLMIIPSIWVAWLVSWPEHPYSPLRLYLAGLILPVLVSFALMKFFTIT